MAQLSGTEDPIRLESVECSPVGEDRVIARLAGTWQGRRRTADDRAVLVIEEGGQRHRFPSMPHRRRMRIGQSTSWDASFVLPASLAAHMGGNAMVWIDNVPVPVPADAAGEDLRAHMAGEIDEHPAPRRGPIELAERIRRLDEPAGDVAALRKELDDRIATETKLRGELARARAELGNREVHEAELEHAVAELRTELRDDLDGLRAMLGYLRTQLEQETARRIELESELLAAAALRDAARREAVALREELEQLGSAHVREPEPGAGAAAAARAAGTSAAREAQVLLAQARSLRRRITEPAPAETEPVRH